MKKRPGGAAVLLRERHPKIVPQWRCEVATWGFRVETLETMRILKFLFFFANSSRMKGPLVKHFSDSGSFWVFVQNVDYFDMKSLLVYIVYMMWQSTVVDGQA